MTDVLNAAPALLHVEMRCWTGTILPVDQGFNFVSDKACVNKDKSVGRIEI